MYYREPSDLERTYMVSVALINSLASRERSSGNSGSVGCVAILKSAAIGSNSAQGGFVLSISTTVQPTLLRNNKQTMNEWMNE